MVNIEQNSFLHPFIVNAYAISTMWQLVVEDNLSPLGIELVLATY